MKIVKQQVCVHLGLDNATFEKTRLTLKALLSFQATCTTSSVRPVWGITQTLVKAIGGLSLESLAITIVSNCDPPHQAHTQQASETET